METYARAQTREAREHRDDDQERRSDDHEPANGAGDGGGAEGGSDANSVLGSDDGSSDARGRMAVLTSYSRQLLQKKRVIQLVVRVLLLTQLFLVLVSCAIAVAGIVLSSSGGGGGGGGEGTTSSNYVLYIALLGLMIVHGVFIVALLVYAPVSRTWIIASFYGRFRLLHVASEQLLATPQMTSQSVTELLVSTVGSEYDLCSRA